MPLDLPSREIRVAVVDDDVNVRTGLWWLLSNIAGLHCVGTYANYQEALQGLKLQAPDIVILDVSMPGISGLDAVRPLRRQSPHIKIIMHSNFDDEDKITSARQAGASGYVLKNASAPALYDAILKVHRGETVWPAGFNESEDTLAQLNFMSRLAARARILLKTTRRR